MGQRNIVCCDAHLKVYTCTPCGDSASFCYSVGMHTGAVYHFWEREMYMGNRMQAG